MLGYHSPKLRFWWEGVVGRKQTLRKRQLRLTHDFLRKIFQRQLEKQKWSLERPHVFHTWVLLVLGTWWYFLPMFDIRTFICYTALMPSGLGGTHHTPPPGTGQPKPKTRPAEGRVTEAWQGPRPGPPEPSLGMFCWRLPKTASNGAAQGRNLRVGLTTDVFKHIVSSEKPSKEKEEQDMIRVRPYILLDSPVM